MSYIYKQRFVSACRIRIDLIGIRRRIQHFFNWESWFGIGMPDPDPDPGKLKFCFLDPNM